MMKAYSVSKIKLIELCVKWWTLSVCIFSPYLLFLVANENYQQLFVDLIGSLLIFPIIFVLFSTEYRIDKENGLLIYKNKFFGISLNEMSISDILTIKLEWNWVIGVKGSVLTLVVRDMSSHLFINDALYDKKALHSMLKDILKLNNKIVTNEYAADLAKRQSLVENKKSFLLKRRVRMISLIITLTTSAILFSYMLLLFFSYSPK
jgi:hypothetical protein